MLFAEAVEWRKTEGKTFSSNFRRSEIEQRDGIDLQECQNVCQENSECAAITYNEDRRLCILRRRTKYGLSEDTFIDRDGVDYYELVGKSMN